MGTAFLFHVVLVGIITASTGLTVVMVLRGFGLDAPIAKQGIDLGLMGLEV